MSKKEKSIWDLNSDLKAYHETSDGHKFYTEETAKSHARSLKNKELKKVSRPFTKSDTTEKVDNSKKGSTASALNSMLAIAKLTTVEAVNKALEGETDTSVIEAGKAQISIIEKAGGKKDFELRAEAVEKLETIEAVEAAIKDETSKTVIKAGEARIEALKAAAAPAE